MPLLIDPRITNWQSEGREIGMLAFHPTETAHNWFPYYQLASNQTFIGVMELDAICIDMDGSLRVYDHQSQNRILCPAAADQQSFVKAVIELETHFERCVEDEGVFDDMVVATIVRDRCAQMAGGDEYVPFFTSLLGV